MRITVYDNYPQVY